MNPWILGGGALAILLLSGPRKASAAQMPSGGGVGPSSRDLDALANLLITETGFKSSREEMAQIVWIAVNRAKAQRRSIPEVVAPGYSPKDSCPWLKGSWNPYGRCPSWNAKGVIYKDRFTRARTFALWPQARAFAAEVLAGAMGPNKGYTVFVHPAAMPKPPCASNRHATSTRYGTRCLPRFAVGGNMVGTALFA
jgi:hypothetical protein